LVERDLAKVEVAGSKPVSRSTSDRQSGARSWHPTVVQEMPGHPTIVIALDMYGHMALALHRVAAESLNALLEQAG
jgi:hypothetical protein